MNISDETQFIERLVRLRLAKGVSARKMSLDIGQCRNYINQIENHKSSLSVKMFFVICDYLEITSFDFFNCDISSPTLTNEVISEFEKKDETSKLLILSLMKQMK